MRHILCAAIHTKTPTRNTFLPLQQIATYCNALQHFAALCNTVTHCNTLQHAATYTLYLHAPQSAQKYAQRHRHGTTSWPLQQIALQSTAAHCSTLQHTATYCNIHIVPACATVSARQSAQRHRHGTPFCRPTFSLPAPMGWLMLVGSIKL